VSLVEAGTHGKIVASDIETGAFEIAKDGCVAKNLLRTENFLECQTLGNDNLK
jgi:methylase of polypeptide subunit release factors